jgi:putative Ig domain-containing protein
VVLAGGLAGTALMSGTAFAGPMQVSTSTSITGTQQTYTSGGTTLAITVTVSAPSGSPNAPAGYVKVSDGTASCDATLTVPSSGLTSTGTCDLTGLAAGTYGLGGSYVPASTQYGGSSSSAYWVYVNASTNYAPQWTANGPSLSTHAGASYSYTFGASGTPTPTYALVDAPSWLSINTSTGAVSGTVPWGTSGGFSYSVAASNSVGTITAGPFAVSVSRGGYHHSGLSTQLSCPSAVSSHGQGTCTLTVTNTGWGRAGGVTAAIYLPSELHAVSCAKGGDTGVGHPWGWYDCTLKGNIVKASLGSMHSGETETLAVSFSAHLNSWGWQQSHAARVTILGQATDNTGVSSATAKVALLPRFYW